MCARLRIRMCRSDLDQLIYAQRLTAGQLFDKVLHANLSRGVGARILFRYFQGRTFDSLGERDVRFSYCLALLCRSPLTSGA